MVGSRNQVEMDEIMSKVAADELSLSALAAANTQACRNELPFRFQLSLDWDLCKFFFFFLFDVNSVLNDLFVGSFWFDKNVYLAPMYCPSTTEQFKLPIGPHQEFAEILATTNGALRDRYSFIVGYKKPVMDDPLSSTLKAGPHCKLRNFPSDLYHQFSERFKLGKEGEDLLADLIKEIFSQGLIFEESNVPKLDPRPDFGDGSRLEVLKNSVAKTASTHKKTTEESVENGESQSDDTSNFMASSDDSNQSVETVRDANTPNSTTLGEDIPWWDRFMIPWYFNSIKKQQ